MPAVFRRSIFLTPVLLAACAHAVGQPVDAPGELAYRITRPSTPRALDLEILRVSGGPAAFTFTAPGGVDHVRAQLADGQQVELSVPASGELDVPNHWVALRYRFTLDDVQRQFGVDLSWGLASESDLVVPGAAWLLRPRFANPGLTARIEAADVLLPWEHAEGAAWQLSSQQLIDSGYATFGGRRCYLTVGGGKLEVGLVGAVHPLGDAAICEWIRSAAEAVLQVRAGFPVDRATVSIVPVPSNEACAFGRVLSSSPRSLAFLIGTDAKPEDFAKDRTVLHELLHLAQPAFEPKENWLSEGLASYQTELVRARTGRDEPIKAWLELLDGFDVGNAEAEGLRMEEVVREHTGARLRRAEAWTGALFALALDLEIRGTTEGHKSLDDVLDSLRQGPVTLAQFGDRVDAIAGKPVFAPLLAAHRRSKAFSPVEKILEQLGVRRYLGEVSFQPAPLAWARDALMTKLPNR
jgi:hypothetical protein